MYKQNLTELKRVIQENLTTTNLEEEGIFNIDAWGKKMKIKPLEGRKTVIFSAGLESGKSLLNYLTPVYSSNI